MANWEGHKPATSAVLLDVITTATTGSAKLSLSDRVLFNACEFWASVRNHTLVGQLGEDADTQLQAAETSFTVIGLAKEAQVVHFARLALADPEHPAALPQVVENIENALANSEGYIDQVIAEYANKQFRERRGL
jgi:hypothetical protein